MYCARTAGSCGCVAARETGAVEGWEAGCVAGDGCGWAFDCGGFSSQPARSAAAHAASRSRDRAREAEVAARPVARESLPLSVRAADEYAYVRRDVWRIGRIAALLLGLMAVLYVLINVLHVLSI